MIDTDDSRPLETRGAEGDRAAVESAGRLAPLAWLGLAAALLLFANGRHTIPAAAWLAPVFLLRFVRGRRAGRGLLVAWLVLATTWAFQFRGMVPVPMLFYVVLAAIYGLLLTLPFVADRLLFPRLDGVAATLVLPFAWVATEYLQTELTPYGSWGAAAYSQHESLVLLQLVSVTGLYGLSFLIAWGAAVCNLVWEQGLGSRPVRRSLFAFGLTLGLVLVFGGGRLSSFPPAAATVRVASLTRADIELLPDPEVAQRAVTGELSEAELEAIRERAARINEDLLARADREAAAGARLVFWGEANAFALKQDEPALVGRAGELARRHGVYVGLAAAVWNAESATPMENKLVLLDPRGEVVWSFLKLRPVPGGEAAISLRDDGRLRVADTPFGRLGGAICFDMDFPDLLRQAGRQGADIMIVPSNDWREIDPWHSHMARVRAVEQGFNMVRHTSNGLSLAADYQGRVLDHMDHFTTATDRVLVSQVPTRGVRTVYSRVGDTFAWLCLAGLAAAVGLALRRQTTQRAVAVDSQTAGEDPQ